MTWLHREEEGRHMSIIGGHRWSLRRGHHDRWRRRGEQMAHRAQAMRGSTPGRYAQRRRWCDLALPRQRSCASGSRRRSRRGWPLAPYEHLLEEAKAVITDCWQGCGDRQPQGGARDGESPEEVIGSFSSRAGFAYRPEAGDADLEAPASGLHGAAKGSQSCNLNVFVHRHEG